MVFRIFMVLRQYFDKNGRSSLGGKTIGRLMAGVDFMHSSVALFRLQFSGKKEYFRGRSKLAILRSPAVI
ncbi:hypothetical protein SAMN05444390_108100 [Marinobacterium lutimaris]|uniref:Uncharacterized protein n=1 Tax=Marinobacterium lutimaris TaxID=568106 RepID=A0A1H6DQR0_9GAMM|nr:hypothetical protein SAMN05444390_108100 [Marinobacterium lutimaris]